MVAEYMIFQEALLTDLAKGVNDLVRVGWQPVGAPFFHPNGTGFWAQALFYPEVNN